MSASTVPAAAEVPVANNVAAMGSDTNAKLDARRRARVVVEKRTSADVAINRTVNGKDQSHAIKGGSMVERIKNCSKLKNELIAQSTISPRRKKIPKTEKPKWQTVLSVLTKNCLLLAALLWLGQTIWRKSYSTGENASFTFAALDYESRISEVEASLKKTSEMLQIQLDKVDEKIGSEIGIVTKDLLKQAEEKGELFEKELKELEARTISLGKSLGALKDMDLVSRDDLAKFLNDIRDSKNSDENNRNLDLDTVMTLARDIVQKEIEKHAADGLGRVDYALASGGAKVVRHSEPYSFGKSNSRFTAKGRNGIHTSAHKMLEPSYGEPGRCFPLQGSSGFIEIKLRTGIIPEAVTLEHISKSVAYDRSSAPKDCRVSAWFEPPEEDSFNNAREIPMLTQFSYALEKSNAQTFNVEAQDSSVVNMVRLDFTSNHGNSAVTCIYRFRVHGYEPSSPAATMALQS